MSSRWFAGPVGLILLAGLAAVTCVAAAGKPGPDTQEVQDPDDPDATLHVRTEPMLDESHVQSAGVAEAYRGEGYAVAVEFNDEGARRMREMTEQNRGSRLAILVDGECVAAPVIKTRVGRHAHIAGDFTLERASEIAAGLDTSPGGSDSAGDGQE